MNIIGNSDMEITINNTTQNAEKWEKDLNKAVDTGWFDCIARHLEENGVAVEHKQAKRKACYVRMAKISPLTGHLAAKHYKEDFGGSMPTDTDGKDWTYFL